MGDLTLFEIEQIRELIQLMAEHDIAQVCIRNGDAHLELKRIGDQTVVHAPPVAVAHAPAPSAPPPPAAAPAKAAPPAATPVEEDDGLVPIESPMVGTFYSAPDPNSPPYVTVGTQVTEDTVVCIVEAMKVFNEIKSEVRGTVEKILASNEEGVDFGQPLFLVRPA
jgi:acetyl-CoA carboxylase biotin carboxyl carrier protein